MDTIINLLAQFWLALFIVYAAVLTVLFMVGRLAVDPGLRGLSISLMFRLFFLAALLLPAGMLLRPGWLPLTLLLPLAVLAVYYAPHFVHRSRLSRSGHSLHFLTFNIEKAETNPQGIASLLRTINADVVALQELSQTAAAYFADTLCDLYPYQALEPQADPYIGQGVLSRFPITADEYWYHPELAYSLGQQRVELNINGMTIVLYNTHPATPISWVKGITTNAHHFEIAEVLNRAAAETAPVLLMGDFNMTTHFDEYALITRVYTDAFAKVGDPSFGFTYPGRGWRPLPPFLRLDYIFYDRHFRGVRTRVWPDCGPSDHYPVLAELELRALAKSSRKRFASFRRLRWRRRISE